MIAASILYLLGYTIDPSFEEGFSKQRIGIFPHTSLCESVLICLALIATGKEKNLCFPVAYQYIESPLHGWWLRYFGGFPVYAGTGIVKSISEYLILNPHKCFGISPEGSLSPKKWKKGFFYIAMNTGIPIIVCGIDFSTHTIKCILNEHYIKNGDDPITVIPKIQDAFASSGIAPLYPENSNPRVIVPYGTKTSMFPIRGKIFLASFGIALFSVIPLLYKLF